jgi:hypothetical protein
MIFNKKNLIIFLSIYLISNTFGNAVQTIFLKKFNFFFIKI